MSEQILKVTIDKFTFVIPKALSYSEAGVWVKLEGTYARLGLSDFAQQHSGDVAFAKVKPVGTDLESGDEFADIETVKVNVSFPSPVKGTIVETNPSLEGAAELINQDPYGKGWLAVVELADWESARTQLLDADAYSALVKDQAETEMKK
jgi:glycine cleavage system H protein